MINYCDSIIDFERVIYFSASTKRICDFPFEIIKIPHLDFQKFNVFVNREVPKYITSDFAMSVHEDGFPIEVGRWKPEFLHYDYIGAPWQDGIVGNGGFNIESQKLLKAKMSLPPTPEELTTASDMYVCRNRKVDLRALGINFAPRDLALEFSSETFGNQWPSFGFHGRDYAVNKYHEGWKIIGNSGS